MTRILSFRFDDGFRAGAERSASLLGDWRATYFIVNGWVTGQKPRWPELRNGDFGDLEFWRSMSSRGHDIQSHSGSHPNFAEISGNDAVDEINESAAFIGQIHSKDRIFCYPFNCFANLDLDTLGFEAGGFVTSSSDQPVNYNIFSATDLYRLNSWAVRERHFDRVVEALRNEVPDDAWIILAFHSLDGEGHEPWSSQSFQRLVRTISGLGYNVETITNVVRNLRRRNSNLFGVPSTGRVRKLQPIA